MGTQHKNVIEINGKHYDAVSGKLISDMPAQQPAAVHTIKPASHVGVVDGFTKRPASAAHTKQRTSAPAPAAHKTTQRSKTLMRSAVPKPAPVSKVAAQPAHAPIKKATLQPSAQRIASAQSVHKSPQISRFSSPQATSSVIKKVQHLQVKQPAKQLQTVSATPPPIHHTKKQSTGHKVAAASIIDKALASATSHELPQHSHASIGKRSRLLHKFGVSTRAASLSMAVVAGLLLGGFFAIQNVPNVSMRVAAARAGFDATMPSYNPSGFSFKGPINYTGGQVTISFSSNTDDRAYTITQRSSNWNSDALLSNFVVTSNHQYQTYLDRGRTLYIYDGSNATWVDSGVWYQIEGESDMTTDQLVRIAASM